MKIRMLDAGGEVLDAISDHQRELAAWAPVEAAWAKEDKALEAVWEVWGEEGEDVAVAAWGDAEAEAKEAWEAWEAWETQEEARRMRL